MSAVFRHKKIMLFLLAAVQMAGVVVGADLQAGGDGFGTISRVPTRAESGSDHYQLYSIAPIRQWSRIDTEETRQCIWVYDGPSPYSHFNVVVVAECESGFSYVVLDTVGAVVDSVSIHGLEPGWYGIQSRRPFPKSAGKWQIISSGEVVKEWARH